MRKQNALIAGAVAITSVLVLAQSANAQYYPPRPGGYQGRPMPSGPGAWQPGPGGPVGYQRPMYGAPVGYPRPVYGAPVGYPRQVYSAPTVLPAYPQPYNNPYNANAQYPAPRQQPVAQQPSNQGAQWNTTSNGWPQFPTASQDLQGAQQFFNNVVVPVCTLFCE